MSKYSTSEKIGIISALILFIYFISFGRTPARFAAILTVLFMILMVPNISGDNPEHKIQNARIVAAILIPLLFFWKQKNHNLQHQSAWIAMWSLVWGLYAIGIINHHDGTGHSTFAIASVCSLNCLFCLIYAAYVHNSNENLIEEGPNE